MDRTLRAALRLQAVPGVGDRTFNRFLDAAADVEIDWRDVVLNPSEENFHRMGMDRGYCDSLARLDGELDDLAALLQGLQVRALIRGESRYPNELISRLGEDAPPVLFVRGPLEALEGAALGVSGSRLASMESLEAARQLSALASVQGASVVSGFAPGADRAAHAGALSAQGLTVLVLPQGILKFRASGGAISDEEFERALILSPFPPNLSWRSHNAMARNRIIMALSDAALLVEPGDSGGTFQAGRIAGRLGTPIHLVAIDGEPRGAGAGWFLQRGASIVDPTDRESVDGLLDACGV